MLVTAGCLVFLAQLVIGLPTTQKPFDGHKVLEIIHNAEADFRKLMEMELLYELDFWKLPRHTNDTMYVHVPANHLEEFLSELEKMNVRVSTFVHNVSELLGEVEAASEHHRKTKRSVASRASGLFLEMYHSYSTISNHLNNLASAGNLPAGITVTKTTIGYSYEGRPIDLVKVSHSTGSAGNKKAIFIDGGIHAREWIAPATVLYIMEQLVYNPGNSPAVTNLLADFDVYLLPLVNPDGYEYSRLSHRLWRKNRRSETNGCYGVDLNRNFPFQWNPMVGGSTNPCSELFSGTNGESEPETHALANFLRQRGSEIAAYLTLHSYGQMWLYPWGYTSALPSDWPDLEYAARRATWLLKRLYRSNYRVGSATNVLYEAAGGSDDFAKGEVGIKYAYTLELRDKGHYGFLLPENQILETSEETFVGILEFVNSMQQIEGGVSRQNSDHGNRGHQHTSGHHGNNGHHGGR